MNCFTAAWLHAKAEVVLKRSSLTQLRASVATAGLVLKVFYVSEENRKGGATEGATADINFHVLGRLDQRQHPSISAQFTCTHECCWARTRLFAHLQTRTINTDEISTFVCVTVCLLPEETSFPQRLHRKVNIPF